MPGGLRTTKTGAHHRSGLGIPRLHREFHCRHGCQQHEFGGGAVQCHPWRRTAVSVCESGPLENGNELFHYETLSAGGGPGSEIVQVWGVNHHPRRSSEHVEEGCDPALQKPIQCPDRPPDEERRQLAVLHGLSEVKRRDCQGCFPNPKDTSDLRCTGE